METLKAAARHASSIAVKLPNGKSCSYGQLLQGSERVHSELQRLLPSVKGRIDGPRIGIYAEPGLPYVAATWASWMSGGVAVPLAVTHPPHELDYVIRDAGISAVLTGPSGHDKLKDISHAAGASLHVIEDSFFDSTDNASKTSSCSSSDSGGPLSNSSSSDSGAGALIVYTSGTTGRPKGALHTHGSLAAQVQCLTSAWQWQPHDVMLHALPLHHVHGVINGLYCAHHIGATVELMPKFSPAAMWKELMSGNITVLMAVPTMYSYLLSYYDTQLSPEQQQVAADAVSKLRLTVSGSAAAPVPLLQRWQALSGQQLLERYGMTETGMILSNPYQGERRAGFVGVPLPGVEVKVIPQATSDSDDSSTGTNGNDKPAPGSTSDSNVGELCVRGPMLFREYWARLEATKAAFDEEGYFLTGDTVSLEGKPPYYRILGRSSVDIIKSGGFKLSALDIEGAILHHPAVAEAAVVGVPDDMLGQVVVALVCLKSAAAGASSGNGGGQLTATKQVESGNLDQQLTKHCQAELPAYAIPRRWKILEQPLPRNAMGKVNKKELLKLFFPEHVASPAS